MSETPAIMSDTDAMARAAKAPCRSCQRTGLELVLSYGHTPLAEVLLTEDQLDQDDPTYPMDLAVCPHCTLVQMIETVPPELVYVEDYPYYSSVSEGLLRHFTDSANTIMRLRPLDEDSLVVEAASNDGYMLKVFAAKGIPVLGVDPAKGPAAEAEKAGVPTICEFFDLSLAERLRSEGQQADVLLANNVLNLVPDLDGFVQGVRMLLKEGGLAVFAPDLACVAQQFERDDRDAARRDDQASKLTLCGR